MFPRIPSSKVAARHRFTCTFASPRPLISSRINSFRTLSLFAGTRRKITPLFAYSCVLFCFPYTALSTPKSLHSIVCTLFCKTWGGGASQFGTASKQSPDVFPHLVFPEGPVVPAVRPPIVEMLRDALPRKHFRKLVGRAAVLPRAGTGRDVDVARGQLFEQPRVVEVREIVHRIVEVKIVVVQPIHEFLQIIDAGHGEAALDHVGMLEERVRGVVCAKGRAHRGDSDALRLAVVPDEGNNLLAQISVEHRLDVTPVKRVRGLVVEAVVVDGIHRVELHLAAVDEVAERADHALAFELEFIAGAGRK